MQFDYLQPSTIQEAISLMTKYHGKAKIIAGGTDLVVQMRNQSLNPQYIVDIEGIPELNYISYHEKQGLRIGALTTIRALEDSSLLQQRYPVICQAAAQLGSSGIRNVATIAGNLCNAAPSAETAPALVGLTAKARIIGPDRERVVSLEKFFTGSGSTVLGLGELLIEIQVPVLMPATRCIYLKHSIRGSIDLAIVSVAVIANLELENEVCRDIRIVLGAVAPIPMRARKAEAVLKGKRITQDIIAKSARVASDEASPISDARASAEYRKEMVRVFTRRAISELWAQ